jgi:hypothetical protein
LVSDTIACLQACEGEPAQALARRLEVERAAAAEDLDGAAERVIVAWEAGDGILLSQDDELRARLDDAADRMQQIARIVLGR